MKLSKDRHTLHPLHYSMQPHLRRMPNDMTRLRDVDPEIMRGMDGIALSIFTDCANAGVPFHQILTAIYLSGLQHATAIADETERK